MHPYLEQICAGEPLRFDDAVQHLGGHLDLLHQLADTPQDPLWHAEGDVAVHTAWVIEEMGGQLGGEDAAAWTLSADDRLVCWLAALLHDVAKPLVTTTRVMDDVERIIAPQHPARGASYLFHRAQPLGLDAASRHELLAQVALHHDPKFLIIKDRPREAYWKLARHADLRLLYLLEQADLRGRACPDRDEQIELIELFRLASEEFGVWDQGSAVYRPFATHIADAMQACATHVIERAIMEGIWDLEAGRIYTPEEAVARAYTTREGCPELVVTCGLSGSGKTTTVRAMFPDHQLISLDALRQELTGDASDQSMNGQVVQLGKERVKAVLRKGGRVIWDATSTRRDARRALLELGRDYGAHTTLLVMDVDVDTARQRNNARQRKVPTSVLTRQLHSFEAPSRDEAHRVVFASASGACAQDTRQWWHALCGVDGDAS